VKFQSIPNQHLTFCSASIFVQEVLVLTGKHYLIEPADKGKFAVRAKDSECACALFGSQLEAFVWAKQLNPYGQPYVQRSPLHDVDSSG
jgi:hypothetical protein